MSIRKACEMLAIFLLAVCLRNTAGDEALDAKVNTISSWMSAGHAWGNSVFTMSAITPETDPVHGQVMRSDITATPTTDGTLNYGYAELRWTSPDTPIDLNNYGRMDFWYKIEVSSGTINNGAWCSMSQPGQGSVSPPGVTWTVDGQWHLMEWPLRPANMTNAGENWNWNVTPVYICFGTPPAQYPGQELNVVFHFGGFNFVPKPDTLSYLLMYDRYGGSTWPNYAPDTQVTAMLEGIGFTAGSVEYTTSPSLNMDYLRQFNLVVFQPFGTSGNSTVNDLLLDYVQQGGGLLILGTWNTVGSPGANNNDLLTPLGANILSEQVFDDINCATVPLGTLGWTDNVATDTVTAGVTGIFYPVTYHPGWEDYTSPLQVNGDWRVLISGRSAAYSMATVKNGSVPPDPTPGTYSSAPPLVAVRNYGAGRIAILPLIPSCIWVDAYHYIWGDGMMMNGIIDSKQGDGAQLLQNLFTHLSEPNLGAFGGWIPQPPAQPAPLEPIDWDNIQLTGCQQPNNYVGLIGAQSSLSAGSSTPQQMIDAAKSAGYNFIAFTEELSSLTEAEFNTLKNVCAANTDAAFQAYPGYKYLDESGNSWVTFSDKSYFTYPQPGWFSTTYPTRLKQNNPICRTFDWPPTILLSSHANPEKPWFQGGFHGFSVYTYQNGTLVDDSLDNYAKMNKMGFNVFPAAVHITTSAAQVTAARNLGYQTNVRWADNNAAQALRGAWGGDDVTGYWLSQASAGPLVEDFRLYYDNRLQREAADRIRIHVLASSPIGLSEVCIYDGDNPTPWRRWKPGGAQTFEQTIDCFHDRQHQFFVTLTDTNGKKSVGWSIPTGVEQNNFARCADNMNTMPCGVYAAIPENILNTRGMETGSASRSWMRYYYGSSNAVMEDIGPQITPAIEYYPELACRFGVVLDALAADHYPGTLNWDQTDLPQQAVPNTQVIGNVRYTLFTPRYDSTLVNLVEAEWATLDDTNFGDFVTFQYSPLMEPTIRYCVTQGGGIYDAEASLTSYIDGPNLPLYGLVGEYPSGRFGSFGAVALEDGTMRYTLPPVGSGYGQIYLKKYGNLTAGNVFSYKFLGVHSRLGPAPDNSFITGLHNTMGLDGTPAYAITPTVGAVEGTHYIACLAAAGYGFSATVQTETDLTIDLPVLITGLNSNWDAGIWYRGTSTLRIPYWTYNQYGQPTGAYQERTEADQLLRIPVLSDGTNVGTGFLQIDGATGTKDVYIGNLLVSDNPNIVLTLTDTREASKKFEAHNPTDSLITCTVQPGPGFTLLGSFSRTITVPAGSSAICPIITAPPTADMILWLKADTGVQKDSNDKVISWQDHSGWANNAVQTNTSVQPVWVANAVNGRPAVLFTKTPATYLTATNNSSLNPTRISIFICGRLRTTPYTGGILLNKEGQYRLIAGDVNNVKQSSRFATTGLGWAAGVVTGAVSLSVDTVYLFEAVYDGSNWKQYLDGTADGSRTAPGNLNTTGSNWDLRLGNGCTGWGINADVAEVIIYNKALSDGDRQAAENYLKNRYGL